MDIGNNELTINANNDRSKIEFHCVKLTGEVDTYLNESYDIYVNVFDSCEDTVITVDNSGMNTNYVFDIWSPSYPDSIGTIIFE